jgi:hypothetical protein
LFRQVKALHKSGITSYVKFGQTSQQAAGVNDYLDYGIRATALLVAKGNYTHMRATEWHATNYDDKTVMEEIEVM